MGIGSETCGLYLFDMQFAKSLGKVNMVMSYNVSKDIWHISLGHPADQVLAALKKDFNLTKPTSMSACKVLHPSQNISPF